MAEGIGILNELIIPCMHLMNNFEISREDLDAIEVMRNRWCSYLGREDMDGRERSLAFVTLSGGRGALLFRREEQLLSVARNTARVAGDGMGEQIRGHSVFWGDVCPFVAEFWFWMAVLVLDFLPLESGSRSSSWVIFVKRNGFPPPRSVHEGFRVSLRGFCR